MSMSEPEVAAAATDQSVIAEKSAVLGNPDPFTGEPGAHPVGVGVGALSAGAAGAAIGSIGGPIGVLIGVAIGAVAGGLAGKEVAATTSEAADAPEFITTATTESVPMTDGEGLDLQCHSIPVADALPMPQWSEEAIRLAAYYRYLDRTRAGQGGVPEDDWEAVKGLKPD